MVTMGDWGDEMLLLFNNMGWYCEMHGITPAELEKIFNAGLSARHQFRAPLEEKAAAN